METPSEELEVVGEDGESADDDERDQRRRDDQDPGDADCQGTDEAERRQHLECPVRELGPQRAPAQLIESVRTHPDRQEEGGERGEQAIRVDLGRSGRAEGDVAQKPERVGRMEDRDQVSPAAR